MVVHPVAIGDRVSVIYVDRGALERDAHSVVIRQGVKDTVIPVGVCGAILLGPGTSVTHAAVSLCAKERTLLVWVGEDGVRLYAAGNPRADGAALLRQAHAHSSPSMRLAIARNIFFHVFDQTAPEHRSIDQLRGLEGSLVQAFYKSEAKRVGIEWQGRDTSGKLLTPIDAALAGVNAALYGLCEACILTLGYSPSIGFVHSGDARSFVFDVADCVKFKTVVPLAFDLAAAGGHDMERRSRTACRQLFVARGMAQHVVDIVVGLMSATDRS